MLTSPFPKTISPVLKLALAAFAVIAAYLYFFDSVRTEHYQIFSARDTATWQEREGGFFRVNAKGNIESSLLSQDIWRDHALELTIANPKDCGLIFDHVDEKNYGFIYLQRSPGMVILGRFTDGATRVIEKIPFALPKIMPVKLVRAGNSVTFSAGGLRPITVAASSSGGRIGLMLTAVNDPPTVFYKVGIEGRLENGTKIRARVHTGRGSGLDKVSLKLLPLVLAVVFLLFFIGGLSGKAKFSFPHVPAGGRYADLAHVLLAACFFFPVIAKGAVGVFSYDNLGEIYPLFFYAKHNFESILAGQAPWLWNPYIHNGFPFYSNHWDMIYYPLNWPVFLLSDKHLLIGLTWKAFFEVATLGILAYRFFLTELDNKRWALFSSITYQMGSMLIFTMSIFPATSLYFSMTFYLYVLWSWERRRPVWNFVLLVLSVVFVLTSANTAFIFYACLSLGVISIYRFLSVRKGGMTIFAVTAGAWVTGIMLSAVRIISCLEGVMASNRVAENFNTIHDRAFMALRLFVPELAGWMGPNALSVLMSPNLNLVFSRLDMPSNPQNNFFIYFGVLPALFLLISSLIKAEGKHLFWKVYAFSALGVALLWQPVWGILSILSFPLNHYAYHTIIVPVGVCALIGHTGVAWEGQKWEWPRVRQPLLIVLGLLAAYILVFLTYLFPSLASFSRVILVLSALGIAGYYLLKTSAPANAQNYCYSLCWAGNVLVLASLLTVTLFLALEPVPKKENVFMGLVLPLLWIAAMAGTAMTNIFGDRPGRPGGWSIWPAAALLCMGLILSPLAKSFLTLPEAERAYWLDVAVGLVRVFLLLQIGVLAISAAAKKALTKKAAVILMLAFTAGDLVAFNARSNDITAPFYFKEAFYPGNFNYKDLDPGLKRGMDLVNFRVSGLDVEQINANRNLVFGIPSYTGTVGYMTKRFSRLLTQFGYPQGIYLLYPEDASQDERFLDLSAVRYVFKAKGQLSERPTALGRLNVVYSAEAVTDDDTALGRLKSESFDPHRAVLLSAAGEFPILRSSKSADIIKIAAARPGMVEAVFETVLPGYLLFNESYDEGWQAYLNGKKARISRANYNFMACELPAAGRYQVRFVFEPGSYRRNLFLSILGLGVLLAGVFIGLMRRK